MECSLAGFHKKFPRRLKKYFLIFAFVAVWIIAILYWISPAWFAQTFLNIPAMSVDVAHILRAIMGLDLGFGLFWLCSAFNNRHRNTAVLTTEIFAGGLVTGRLISLLADGWPSPILLVYVALEFLLIPIAVWVFRLPE